MRSSSTPTAKRHGERHRDRHQRVEPKRARRELLKDGLHRVRRVGAQHQHLAVRHVDDAQQTEGDRQAERREQQHAGQAHAVDQAARGADPVLLRHDAVDRARRRRAHARVGLAVAAVAVAARRCAADRPGSASLPVRMDLLDRRQARVGVRALQIDARHRQRQRLAHAFDLFLVERLVQQRRAPRASCSSPAPRPPRAAAPRRAIRAAAAP